MNDQQTELVVYDKVYQRQDGKPGKNYRELMVDGKLLYEFEPKEGRAGALYDPVEKKLVRGTAPPISSENAASLVEIRENKKYQLKVEGVKRALKRNGKYVDKLSDITDEQAIIAVMDAVTDHAIDKYAPGSAHVKGKLMDALDMMPDKRHREEDAPPGTVRLTVTTTIQELRKHMEDKYRDAIDGV